jgi:hypothetical protein
MPLTTIAAGTGAIPDINDNFIATGAAAVYGRRAATSAGLDWGYYGGFAFGNQVDNDAITVTPSSTNYVVASRSTGAVSISTSLTNWNNTADYYRLYVVVAGALTITSYTDHREFIGGSGGGGGSSAWADLTGVPAPIEDLAALTDPGADRLLMWDDSAGAYTHATLGTNLSFTGTTLNATGAGGAAWGTLSGTLSDQTDLQAALDAKAAVGIPQNSQSAAYTLVLSDANKHLLHPSADATARIFTIPANASVAYPIGTALTFVNQNGAGVITIAITSDTMRLAGVGSTGNRTLAANGICTALKLTSTEWIISGTGLT